MNTHPWYKNNNEFANGYLLHFEKSQGGFRVYDSETKELTDMFTLPRNRRHFYLLKGYDADDKGLLLFAEEFKRDCDELRSKKNSFLQIHYDNYMAHHFAVELTFKRLCKGKYEHFENIDLEESIIEGKCFNAGLMYCAVKGEYESYGYDMKMFYPSLLASEDLKIPMKKGKYKTLTVLPKRIKLKQGYYHVVIMSNNEDVKKVFSFSKHNWYTKESLKFAMENKNKYGFNIALHESENNAYVYKKRDCITGKEIFCKWYEIMAGLRRTFPKNKLVKHLSSSVWTHITRPQTRNVTLQQIKDGKLDVGLGNDRDFTILEHITLGEKKDYYIIRDNKKPHPFNIRLKSFLVSLGRNKMAEIIGHDIDNFIRVQTDGVVFKKNQNFDIKNLIPEDKTTGLIRWDHVNSYQKV